MDVTLAKLLASCPVGIAVVFDGGLSKRITWVHATELADPPVIFKVAR